jgi:hypothetical protein
LTRGGVDFLWLFIAVNKKTFVFYVLCVFLSMMDALILGIDTGRVHSKEAGIYEPACLSCWLYCSYYWQIYRYINAISFEMFWVRYLRH